MASLTTFDPPSGVGVALTTPFTAPSSCATLPIVGSNTESTMSAPFVQVYFSSDCYPPSFQDVQNTYSPGMCPFGQTTAIAIEKSGTTSAQCCRDDGRWNISYNFCVTTISTPLVVERWYTGTGIDFTLYTTTTLTSAILAADGVHVFYQQKDLSLFPAGYTPGPVTAAASSTVAIGGPTPTSSQQTTGASQTTIIPSSQKTTGVSQPTIIQSSSGLSSGAKTGIGIGVGLGLILFALGILFIVWKRRSMHVKEVLHPGGPELHGDDIKEISGQELERHPPISVELAAPESHHPTLKSGDEGKLILEKDEEHTSSTATEHTQSRPSQNILNLAEEPAELGTADGYDVRPELDANQTQKDSDIQELPSQPHPSAFKSSAASTPKYKQLHSQAGPVQDFLSEQGSDAATMAQKEGGMQVPSESASSPLSEQELEIQWLAREEARIRERKELLQRGLQK